MEDYFDDDDLINDYIDDDEPPPPPLSPPRRDRDRAAAAESAAAAAEGGGAAAGAGARAAAASAPAGGGGTATGGNNDYDDDFLEEVLREQQELQQLQQQQQSPSAVRNSTAAEAFPGGPAGGDRRDDDVAGNDVADDDDLEYDDDPGAAAGGGDGRRTSSEEEVRAEFARRQQSSPGTRRRRDDDIFAFERYDPKKSSWRLENDGEGQDGGGGAAAGAASSPRRTMHAKGWKTSSGATAAAAPSNRSIPFRPSSSSNKASAPESQLLEFQLQQQQNRSRSSPLSKRQLKGLSYAPIANRKCVPITFGDGTRMHVRVRKEKSSPAAAPSNATANAVTNSRMLGVSMGALLRRVNSKRLQREFDLQRNLRELHGGIDDGDDGDEEMGEPSAAAASPNGKKKSSAAAAVTDSQLWVDKHAPSSFAHLLSDERTNRQVVRALREWDRYVFGRDPLPPRHKPQQQSQSQSQQQGPDSGNSKKAHDNRQNANPRDKRPEFDKRVILLSGPPGVGKTTLAHVIANHVGYRCVEVNGSDERSASVLTERVVRAMESHTLHRSGESSGGNRPNCLILDEIDGADAKGAIQSLVEIIRADMPTSKEASKRKKRAQYLRRPIIFICNNMYSPALRPLLPFARQFHVTPPSPCRLVSRLLSILQAEQLQLSGGTSLLHTLVGLAGGDIRSSLHTLQFVAAEAKQRSIRAADSSAANLVGKSSSVDLTAALQEVLSSEGSGMKDERNDIAGTITTIFRKQKRSKNLSSPALLRRSSSKMGGNVAAADTERVLDSVQGFGDNSRILDGLFMNILRVSYIDPTLDRCAAAHEWMSSSDTYRSPASIGSASFHTMEAWHIPPAAAAIHLLCRVEQRPDLTFTTREFFDARYQQEANQSLLQKFHDGLTPMARSSRSAWPDLVTTEIPYILWILSAGDGSSALDRGTSSYDLLNKEKGSFNNHAGVLVSLGLTYVTSHDDNEGGRSKSKNNNSYRLLNSTIQLEPPIDRLVQFVDLHLSNDQRRREVAPTLKELLAQRASYEKMRNKSNSAAEKKSQAPTKQLASTAKEALTVVSEKETAENATSSSSAIAATASSTLSKHKRDGQAGGANTSSSRLPVPEAKRPRMSPNNKLTAQNFLGVGAMKAKEARSRQKAARVGLSQRVPKRNKTSHTGSGVQLSQVIRLKYLKGFTEAVRTPCRLEDLN